MLLLTVQEVAAKLRLSVAYVQHLIRKGQISAHVVNQKQFIDIAQLDKLVSGHSFRENPDIPWDQYTTIQDFTSVVPITGRQVGNWLRQGRFPNTIRVGHQYYLSLRDIEHVTGLSATLFRSVAEKASSEGEQRGRRKSRKEAHKS